MNVTLSVHVIPDAIIDGLFITHGNFVDRVDQIAPVDPFQVGGEGWFVEDFGVVVEDPTKLGLSLQDWAVQSLEAFDRTKKR